MFLSWIIPCHNEERRIEKTLREVDAYLRMKPFEYEIIVVNNASVDKTGEIVTRLQNVIKGLRLIETRGKGKGWAVRVGMLEAGGDIRLFSDADNATAPEHFDKMIPFFNRGFDVVISSRNPKDAAGAVEERKEEILRVLAGRLGNLWIQFWAVPGIWDTQNGFKAFRAKAAQDIFSRVRMGGFSFDIEVLALARCLKYRIGCIPVRWVHDPNSKVTLKSYFEVLWDTVKIRWNLITNKYQC